MKVHIDIIIESILKLDSIRVIKDQEEVKKE